MDAIRFTTAPFIDTEGVPEPMTTAVTAVPESSLVSFDEFFREHRDRVGRALALTLTDEDLGFEAADEAMAKALQRWDTVRQYSNPEGWVYRVGLNWARSFLRKRRRAKSKAALVARPHTTTDTPANTDLEGAIARLSDDHRSVVVLRFYWDLTTDQTAEVLGVAPGTVKSRLSRALDALAASPTT